MEAGNYGPSDQTPVDGIPVVGATPQATSVIPGAGPLQTPTGYPGAVPAEQASIPVQTTADTAPMAAPTPQAADGHFASAQPQIPAAGAYAYPAAQASPSAHHQAHDGAFAAAYPAAPAMPAMPAAAASPEVAEPAAAPGVDAAALDLRSYLESMMREAVQQRASDLHLTEGSHPMIRIDGSLQPLTQYPIFTSRNLQQLLYSVLSSEQRERFERELELDAAVAYPGVGRMRMNVYRQRDSLGAAFRFITENIRNLEELNMPSLLEDLVMMPRGLVLVTGPTGSGKSSTLAAMVDYANRHRSDHILTVEDPIEYLHTSKGCIVNQREVGPDTHSFAAALKHALRQDPDIILVGEMRDLETIGVALTAAETGHLVLATLHTQSAAQTIDRIIDVFPSDQQHQVRAQLSTTLQAIITQTLCAKTSGTGRIAASEIMTVTPAIRNLLREGKSHQIYSMLQAGGAQGMRTMDQHLAELVANQSITFETAMEKAQNLDEFKRMCGRA